MLGQAVDQSEFVSALVQRLAIARSEADHQTETRLAHRFSLAAAKGRVTDWDRLSEDTYVALHSGENARADALAR